MENKVPGTSKEFLYFPKRKVFGAGKEFLKKTIYFVTNYNLGCY
jgi:hypothetical protein